MKIKKLVALFTILTIIFSIYAQNKKDDMQQVLQSVEMLNYVSTLSERIKENKDNRLQLNQIRDEIYNNIIPSSIDDYTQSLITGDGGFLDCIQTYQLIGLQRERLEYIAEMQRAKALKSAMPDPVYILSIVKSGSLKKAIVSIVTTTASSALSYIDTKNALNIENMQNTWELDDKETATFEDQRKETFDYMIDISRRYNMPKEYTLSEENLKDFVKFQSDTNLNKRLAELEKDDNSKLYLGAKYGPYYLLLANTYYELGQYQNCIDIFESYENRNVRVFRKDYDAARVIPEVIYSAKQVYGTKRYIEETQKYLNLLKNETSDKDWDLRYFAALTYIELAEVDSVNRNVYLRQAVEILLSNISYLAGEQQDDLRKYAEPLDSTIPKGITKKDEKVIKALINQKKHERKTGLPPFKESLYLNCELLNSIRVNYKISDSNWDNKFLKVTENAIVNVPLRSSYGFEVSTINVNINDYSLKEKKSKNIFKKAGNKVVELKNKITKNDKNKVQDAIEKEQQKATSNNKKNKVLVRVANEFLVDFPKKNTITLPASFFEEDSKISIKLFNTDDKTTVIMMNLPYKIKEIKRPKIRDMKLPEDVLEYINDFDAEIELNLKDYKVNFSDFDLALIIVESYEKKLSLLANKNKK